MQGTEKRLDKKPKTGSQYDQQSGDPDSHEEAASTPKMLNAILARLLTPLGNNLLSSGQANSQCSSPCSHRDTTFLNKDPLQLSHRFAFFTTSITHHHHRF